MPLSLKNKRIALWFFGNGFRNRTAFEIGARSMGADVSYIPGDLGINEPLDDIAHYLDNWFSMAVIRCQSFDDLQKYADDSQKPVINARTNVNHPCEIMGDLQYIRTVRKSLNDLNVVFVGEMTNLCGSWFEAAHVLPIHVTQVAPPGFEAPENLVRTLTTGAAGTISVTADLQKAVTRKTDVLYTDCWPRNIDKKTAYNAFMPYRITRDCVNHMNPRGFFMPCPPVTRGEEITADSLAAEQYCNYAAKTYLLHAQNAVMEYCLHT